MKPVKHIQIKNYLGVWLVRVYLPLSLPRSNPENGPGFETNQIMMPADSPAVVCTVMNHVLLGRLPLRYSMVCVIMKAPARSIAQGVSSYCDRARVCHLATLSIRAFMMCEATSTCWLGMKITATHKLVPGCLGKVT